jgi:ketol-acid reductoisomerase
VGRRRDHAGRHRAGQEGRFFEVYDAKGAAEKGRLIQILAQDDVQAKLYREAVAPSMKAGKALVFSHGFNIHFGQIIPPKDVDVFMIAPKGPGATVRSQYLEGKGVPALVAIHQNASGNALKIALAYGKGIGASRAGIMETTFVRSPDRPLRRASGPCGGLTELVRAGFDLGAGRLPTRGRLFRVHARGEAHRRPDDREGHLRHARLHLHHRPFWRCDPRSSRRHRPDPHGDAAHPGEIQSGLFAREFILENQANRPVFNALMRHDANHLIEQVGVKVRSMFSWHKKA